MLGKLIVYELKCTYKKVLALILAGLVTAILTCILINSTPDDDGIIIIVSVLTFVGIVSLFILFFCIISHLSNRMNKSFYSRQGYLTLTLPASRLTIFNSKLIVAFLWGLVSFFAYINYSFILMAHDDITNITQIYRIIGDLLTHTSHPFLTIIFPMICFFIKTVSLFLFIFACNSLSQLVTNHRRAFGTLTGIGVLIVVAIINSMIGKAFIDSNYITGSLQYFLMPLIPIVGPSNSRILDNLSAGIFLTSIIPALIYYLISAVILCNKVNLD